MISQEPISIQVRVIGSAAARPESWVADTAEEVTVTTFAYHAAVFVSRNTLNPVVLSGQMALLRSEDIIPQDDDLVAVTSVDGSRYLRRVWHDRDEYILQAIHPTKPVAAIRLSKARAAIRKVVGVLYDTPCDPVDGSSPAVSEWLPCERVPIREMKVFKALTVEGNSLDPIARRGQKVLVRDGRTAAEAATEGVCLAAIESEDPSIGNVIKRVFPRGDTLILVSPNPVEPLVPDVVPIESVKRVWPLCGALFETSDDLVEVE